MGGDRGAGAGTLGPGTVRPSRAKCRRRLRRCRPTSSRLQERPLAANPFWLSARQFGFFRLAAADLPSRVGQALGHSRPDSRRAASARRPCANAPGRKPQIAAMLGAAKGERPSDRPLRRTQGSRLRIYSGATPQWVSCCPPPALCWPSIAVSSGSGPERMWRGASGTTRVGCQAMDGLSADPR